MGKEFDPYLKRVQNMIAKRLEATGMTWKDMVYRQVIEFCNDSGSRTFSLKDFLCAKLDLLKAFKPNNANVEAKIRQQLQVLRDDKVITFLDNSGHYTLRGVDLLKDEVEDLKNIDISRENPEKKEYLLETYVRSVKWAKEAKNRLGDYCLLKDCKNSFIKEDGERYIEVHHIVPLYEGGEDGLWNLSVLCAHHHRMAHFANANERLALEKYLLKEVRYRI